MEFPSYGKVLALGHRDLEGLLTSSVHVQEKYDGSQMSWAWDERGLWVRSRSRLQFSPDLRIDDVDGLFRRAVEHLLDQKPVFNRVFRGEAITSPRHNTLTYDRTPDGFLVLFDVEMPNNNGFVFGSSLLAQFANRLGIEAARQFARKVGQEYWQPGELTMSVLNELLEFESSLGGPKVEGVVVKNYTLTNPRSGRPFLAGKFVSEKFKEVHKGRWKKANPNQGDIVQGLIDGFNTEARWEKAVQHLRERGELEGSPRDIGALMREVKADVFEEHEVDIVEALMKWARPRIQRGLGRGLPEWYKTRLAKEQFNADE